MKIESIKKVVIKSMTNNNEKAKQTFKLCKGQNLDDSILIERIVLTTDLDLFKKSEVLRQTENYRLVKDSFGIKLKTLTIALHELTK
jgi:hypothetical protein